jgi:hypothetical protein
MTLCHLIMRGAMAGGLEVTRATIRATWCELRGSLPCPKNWFGRIGGSWTTAENADSQKPDRLFSAQRHSHSLSHF